MYLNVGKSHKGPYMSIVHAYRDPVTKKIKRKTIKSIGYVEDFLDQYEDPIAHFKEVARQMEEERLASEAEKLCTLTLSLSSKLTESVDHSKNIGFVALSYIYHQLGIHSFLKSRQRRYKIDFSLDKVMQLLLYARSLFPSSKLASFLKKENFFLDCNFELHDVYRSLDYFSELKDELLLHVHENVVQHYGRKTDVVMYDVTNFYFEIEKEDDFRRKGFCKHNSRKPLVQMGLLLDKEALPITYQTFPGNTHDSQTFMPVLYETRKKYNLGRVITVADKALNSGDNVAFLMAKGDGFIFSQKIRGASEELQKFVFNSEGYKNISKTVKNKDGEEEEKLVMRIKSRDYPQEFWVTHSDDKKRQVPLDVKQLVCYSVKYAKRQRRKREEAIAKALEIIDRPTRYNKKQTAGALRYVADISYDKETGEVIDSGKVPYLDEAKIKEDEKYDGYYVLITSEHKMADLEIIKAYQQLWKIERSFRITKSTLEARPVYLSKENRIDAHFLTCFLSLLFIRLLEKKLDNTFSPEQIIQSLGRSNVALVGENVYKNLYYDELMAKLTEKLALPFDYENYSLGGIKKLIAKSKKF